MRVVASERASSLFLASMALLPPLKFLALKFLSLKLLQIVVEAIEPLVPHAPIGFEPFVHILKAARLDAGRAPLRFAAACDEACALEHFQMFGNSRQRHVERLGELLHGGFTECQTRENGAPRGVRERGKGETERVRGHARKTIWLNNCSV